MGAGSFRVKGGSRLQRRRAASSLRWRSAWIASGRADRDHVLDDHHPGQASIALAGVLEVEVENRVLFPFEQPAVLGDRGVVPVGRAAPAPPVVEPGAGDAHAVDGAAERPLRAARAGLDRGDDVVADLGGDPASRQRPPEFFLSSMSSPVTSAMISSLRATTRRRR